MKTAFNISITTLLATIFSLMFSASAYSQRGTNAMSSPSPVDGVTFRFIEANGLRMRIAEAGDTGPLILLAHGWPESWYSWRHQLTGLAAAGYRVVAPDMRGYGETDKPAAVNDYDTVHTAGDMVGILDALGEETAIMVGHDWGSLVAWNTVLMYPDRFSALIAMSVPYGGRAAQSPLASWKAAFGDNFYYILYHNEAGGVAEAEYDSDPRGLISRLYLSPQSPREAPTITDPKRSAGGWIGRLGAPIGLPDWLTQQDLDYVVGQFEMAGFRGGVNYYRNFHRNWEITEHLDGVKVAVPTLFIAGERDVVIAGASKEALTNSMSRVVDDLRGVILIPEIGHWVQQEAPEATNAAMLEFLGGL
ncbi:MAG: alpha/beta hydrolase [Proteobacteria bacterium]|nr:alpha/beta hydrolase [Pseudomonadota bacterium]